MLFQREQALGYYLCILIKTLSCLTNMIQTAARADLAHLFIHPITCLSQHSDVLSPVRKSDTLYMVL